jgi:tetratricopeptide (TPR) repeat protein
MFGLNAAVFHKAQPGHQPMVDRRSVAREWSVSLCLVLIVGAAFAAYHNSFSGPFVFDDVPAIVENPSIRHLWPLTRVMAPPLTAAGATGRPMVNLSLAVNYALGGTNVAGYHVLNLLLHVAVAVVLFSLLLRTFRLPPLGELFEGKARHLALSIALLWTVHPLLTESVTATIQRNELIVGLFYLLTLYGVARSVNSTTKAFWYAWAIAACLLGMASKEVMATAPVMALLYDRAFLSGSFKKALLQRWPLYLGLAATWVLLAALIVSHRDRAGTVGFGLGVPWWAYALTQCQAVVCYLGLAVWPRGLVFDYGAGVVRDFALVWPQASILLVLLGATAYATVRRPQLGFLGCWFFGILAPSSSVFPLATQTTAEHRMYLPLIAVVVLATAGLFAKVNNRNGIVVVGVVAALLGWNTIRRNEVYKSAVTLWGDTISKHPENPRAHKELGNVLDSAGRMPEALASYDRALQLRPDYMTALCDKAATLLRMGQASAAVPVYEEALKLRPDDSGAARKLGMALLAAGRPSEAIDRLEAVLRSDPRDAVAQSSLGYAFWQDGRMEMAVSHFAAATQLQPDSAEGHYNYARALARAARLADAIEEYRRVVTLKPDDAVAYYNMGNAYAQTGQLLQAVAAYEEAVRHRPEYPEAHNNCGTILRRLGRLEEARMHYGLALKFRPDYPQAQRNLAALVEGGDVSSMQE